MFRQEAITAHRERLKGEILLAGPSSWFWLIMVYALLVTGAGLYLATGSYARMETVGGRLVPSRGIIPIGTKRQGIISAVPVREGDVVAAGTVLVKITTEQIQPSGKSLEAGQIDILGQRISANDAQMAASQRALEATLESLNNDIQAAKDQLHVIDEQIRWQTEKRNLARQTLEGVVELANRNVSSRQALREAQATLANREQELADLSGQRLATTYRLQGSELRIVQEQANNATEQSALTVKRLELEKLMSEIEGRRDYALIAPVAGRVTAVDARVGDTSDVGHVLMAILPENRQLEAEFHVPSTAIGFIRKGLDVRLRLAAFPYEHFGAVAAHITDVAEAPTIDTKGDGGTPSYLVLATLDQPDMIAFSRRIALQPGMTLKAGIITARRSLFAWLFEPLLAVWTCNGIVPVT